MTLSRIAFLTLSVAQITSFVEAQDPAAPPPMKVYLLAGQSNMVGYTSAEWVREHAPELVAPREDVWCYWNGACRPLAPGAGHEVGPELAFGHAIGDRLAQPVLLAKFAVGGTTLHRDWRPPSAVARAGGAPHAIAVPRFGDDQTILRKDLQRAVDRDFCQPVVDGKFPDRGQKRTAG